jgi:hypothetical protein
VGEKAWGKLEKAPAEELRGAGVFELGLVRLEREGGQKRLSTETLAIEA